MTRSAGVILKGSKVIGIEPIPPTIKRLRRYAEIATGKPCIAMAKIMIHPLQPLRSFAGDRALAKKRDHIF